MPRDIKIILFEDSAQTRSRILDAMKKHLGKYGLVLAFEPGKPESEDDKKAMYEDRIVKILSSPPYDKPTLLMADRDLSKSQNFLGMSVSAVTGAARRLGVPVCSYARQPAPEYKSRARWEEGHIVLASDDDDELGRQAVLAAFGFAEINRRLPKVIKNIGSPSKLMAALLDKPEYSDKIALYSVGDQSRLSEIPFEARDKQDRQNRATPFLGYWLWDSILRYPGLLVNEIAAASHLNIETADFRNPEIRGLFKAALYKGPFADEGKPQWWRGTMDDIVSKTGCSDGLELARKKLNLQIRASRCSVNPEKTAGYYCIISEKPVSLENSRGGLSWFPRGADLTRISTPLFEEYGPWIGA
jgi:hypothetical protein